VGVSTSWNPQGLSRTVIGLLFCTSPNTVIILWNGKYMKHAKHKTEISNAHILVSKPEQTNNNVKMNLGEAGC